MSEEELLEGTHLESHREEFFRRLTGVSAAERAAAMERFRDASRRRAFPGDYGNEELLELVLNSSEPNPSGKALAELAERYANAGAEAHAALAARLREAYRAAVYPVLLPDMSNSLEFTINHDKFSRIDRATRTLLPEAEALALLGEVYLKSGRPGGMTRFLGQIAGSAFTGPATLAVVEALDARVAGLSPGELDALGEHEAISSIIHARIRQCSDNDFASIQARDWKRNSLDIHALGSSEDPEARRLLLEHYRALSRDGAPIREQLEVLRALMARWDRERDLEFRNLLREDLPAMLRQDHHDDLPLLMKIVELIGSTGDPYYAPLLKRSRAELDLARIRRSGRMPGEYLEINIRSTMKHFDEALAALGEGGS